MVKGLTLARLGYTRGARVRVRDPAGGRGHADWIYTVLNDETATMTNREPPPPAWIQPGILIEIQIGEDAEVAGASGSLDLSRFARPPKRPVSTVAGSDDGHGKARAASAGAPASDGSQTRPDAIWVVDIGKPGQGFGWARLSDEDGAVPCGGTDGSTLAEGVGADLAGGLSVALGFEGPMFLGVPEDFAAVTAPRSGEIARGLNCTWWAQIGVRVTALGVPLVAWILRAIRKDYGGVLDVRIAPQAWAGRSFSDRPCLFLWEALVFGPGHARGPNVHGVSEHVQDAGTAALAFRNWSRCNPQPDSDVTADPCISIVGAAALWSGLSLDTGLLQQQSLVLWPSDPLGADTRPWDVPSWEDEAATEGGLDERP